MTKFSTQWQRTRGTFGANAALTGATNIVLGALGLATGAAVARLLGPRARGELAAIQTWPTLLGILGLLGTGDALVYYSAREPENSGAYLGTALSISLLASGPLMLAAYIAMPLLLRAQPATAVVAARWYLLFVPVQALAGLPFYPLRGRNDFFVWNALRITPTLPWIVVLTAAWLVEWRSPSRLAYCYLAGLASLFFPIAFVAKRRIPGSFAPKAQKFNPLLRYGLLCMMTTVPQLLNFRLDQMLMAGLLRPVDLGLYVAAVAWSGAVNPLLSAVGWALFPKVASEPSREARTRAFAKASRLAALLAAILGLLLLVSTPWGMILLFGRKFLPALKATFILIPAAAVAGLNTVLEEGLRGLGHPASVMRGEFAGLLITVVALAIMLRPLGIIGASFASLLGYSTVTLALITQSRWLTGASVRTLLFPSRSEIYSGLCQLRSTARQAVSLQS